MLTKGNAINRDIGSSCEYGMEKYDEFVVSIEMIKKSLRTCELIPAEIRSGLSDQPVSFYQGLVETTPKGLDRVRAFLGPDLVEWGDIIFHTIQRLLR